MENVEEKVQLEFKKKFTEEQKLKILKELERGLITQSELSRGYGIHPMTIYKWRRDLNAITKTAEEIKLKELLEELEKYKSENKLLRKIVADKEMSIEILQTANEVIKKRVELQKQNSPKKP